MKKSILTKSQKKDFVKFYTERGERHRITAHVRHDAKCGNGHNTFSITGSIDRKSKNGSWIDGYGGCIHDEIAKHFPELAPFIKWHLTSADEPMHYVANAVYLAGNRDFKGLLKGEFRQHTSRGSQNNGVAGVPNWTLEIPEGIATDIYAKEKPAPVLVEWKAYGTTGEGKERQLDAARKVAIWPEATDEQLSAEPAELTKVLLARLPKLMEEFQTAVESLGFTY